MRPWPEGSEEDASSCRTVQGEAHRQRHQAVPPISHRLALPSPCQAVTSGSLQAWSRCAAERWTGMRLWGRTSPSSRQRQLAACALCLCRTDALLLRGAAQGLHANATNFCWGQDNVLGWGCWEAYLSTRKMQRVDNTHASFKGKGLSLFWGYLEFLGVAAGVTGSGNGSGKKELGLQCKVWKVVLFWEEGL